MIDLHCHILPGVDDGAKTMEDSLDMARHAASEGIDTIVATPHHQNGKYVNEKSRIFEQVNELNKRLIEEKIPVKILPGQETRIYGQLVQDYIDGKVLTLNNTHKYLFVELPSSQVPQFTEQLLYEIQSNGLTPIIVHPERNSRLIEQPDILYNLVNKGALTQVTASSLIGYFGAKVKRFSLDLIDSNLTHMFASDAHNTNKRNFHMREASEIILKEHGEETLGLFYENVNQIILGKSCYKNPPERVIKKKKFLGIF